MSLMDEDREALIPFECECDLATRCDCDRQMVAAVEAIVARHVAAALEAAAVEIEVAPGAAIDGPMVSRSRAASIVRAAAHSPPT